MAKKKLGAKKLLNSRVNKLKYLAKKYELIKEVSPRDYIKKPITVNNRKFKSKYEAELYIKEQKDYILTKLRKTKTYQQFLFNTENKGGKVTESYPLEISRYWERDKLEDYINGTNEITHINGMSKETNMHGIHSLLDILFATLDSASAIGINMADDGRCSLFTQTSEKLKKK